MRTIVPGSQRRELLGKSARLHESWSRGGGKRESHIVFHNKDFWSPVISKNVTLPFPSFPMYYVIQEMFCEKGSWLAPQDVATFVHWDVFWPFCIKIETFFWSGKIWDEMLHILGRPTPNSLRMNRNFPCRPSMKFVNFDITAPSMWIYPFRKLPTVKLISSVFFFMHRTGLQKNEKRGRHY